MNADEIKKRIKLQNKNIEELQTICKTLSLPENESKSTLINTIINGTIEGSIKIEDQPQLIALKTRDQNNLLIEEAQACLKYWRQLLFKSNSSPKPFQILNNQQKTYTVHMKAIQCTSKVALEVIKRRWYLPNSYQKKLIHEILNNPDQFNYHIVQKHSNNGNNWIMLHVEKMAA